MRALSASELLDIWEKGLCLQSFERGIALLAAACPEVLPEELARLSIGQRDSLLFALREWTFGPVTACPHCGEQLEMSIKVDDIRAESGHDQAEMLSLSSEGYQIRFHLPSSLDLAAIASAENIVAGRQVLLERCIEKASFDGSDVSSGQLPQEVISSVVEMMEKSDPQADVYFEISCPVCNYQWQAILDMLSFFWREICAWARRTLRDVHALAFAYGWSEVDILSLSPRRRQIYLELVNG
jgi:hypothetical protein